MNYGEPVGLEFLRKLNLESWLRQITVTGEASISDEHLSKMFWETGDPSYEGPYSENPYYSGGMNARASRLIDQGAYSDRSIYSFGCKFCGAGITFRAGKPFDANGAHRCLAVSSAARAAAKLPKRSTPDGGRNFAKGVGVDNIGGPWLD